MRTIPHWVDGKPLAAGSPRTGPVFDPAVGRQTAEVGHADVTLVNTAVASALDAVDDWRETPVTRRQAVMFDLRRVLVDRRLELAEVVTSEHGKTVPDALGEVQRGLEVVEFACNITHLM